MSLSLSYTHTHTHTIVGLLRSGGGLNPLVSGSVVQAMKLHDGKAFLDHLGSIQREYSRLNEILCSSLEQHFPSNGQDEPVLTFEKAEGGFFVWVRFDPKKVPDARYSLILIPKTIRPNFCCFC